MSIIIKFVLIIATAFLAAAMLALFKIGAGEIFRYAEQRWMGKGVIFVLFCWVIVLPIMVLLSLILGLYLFAINKRYQLLRDKHSMR